MYCSSPRPFLRPAIFLVRVVLLGAARLFYDFTKLLVGPRRPGVRRFLLPMFSLASLAAVARVAAAAPGAVWGISTKQAAHLVNIPAIFWVVRPRGDRDRRVAVDRRAGSRGGGAGLPGGPALALATERASARLLCVGSRARGWPPGAPDRALALKVVPRTLRFSAARAPYRWPPRSTASHRSAGVLSSHASAGCSALRQV